MGIQRDGGGISPRAALHRHAPCRAERRGAHGGGRLPAGHDEDPRGHRGDLQPDRGRGHERDGERAQRAPAERTTAVWAAPPEWLYLPSQGIGIGEDIIPVGTPPQLTGCTGDDERRADAGATRIRGRGTTPGAHCMTSRATAVGGDGSGTGAAVGSRDAAQQTLDTSAQREDLAVGARRKAEERLAASHTGIAASLADHAERVARKSARGGRGEGPSAADRMAALRRRISERKLAAGDAMKQAEGAAAPGSPNTGLHCRGDDRGRELLGRLGVGLEASATPTSNEDVKMHSAAASNSLDDCTAEDAGGGGPNHADLHAAAAWAWHARAPGGAGDGGSHLSAT
jgi:hypothetical protein